MLLVTNADAPAFELSAPGLRSLAVPSVGFTPRWAR
jgi:hypothetical protein